MNKNKSQTKFIRHANESFYKKIPNNLSKKTLNPKYLIPTLMKNEKDSIEKAFFTKGKKETKKCFGKECF